jgi:very-short-patch-repair endonuclease
VSFDPRNLQPFRRFEVAALGLTDADVRRYSDNGLIIRLARGIYVGCNVLPPGASDSTTALVRAKAMLRRYPTGVVDGRTAAAIHGLWVIGPLGPVVLSRKAGWRRENRDVVVDEAEIPGDEVVYVDGVPVTSIARSCVGAMNGVLPGEALALADSALRAGVSREELHGVLASEIDSRHRVIAFADSRSESALESVSRWAIRQSRLPLPELQVSFDLSDGSVARVDFIWPDAKVIGEADGALKYDEEGVAKRAEEVRQSGLEEFGYEVVRWGWHDATERSAQWLGRLRSALERSSKNAF